MAYRSQSKRQLRPSLFALLAAALVPPLVAGCQSNVQHDLVAREMRMQEDQIYAMEDYLAQYQDLICKYRAENAALRDQLGEADDATVPAQRPSPRTRNGPAIDAPPRRTNGTPPQELELPDVPPLGETTSTDELHFNSRPADSDVALATGQSATKVLLATQAVAVDQAAEREPIRDIWLHGEVVENDTGGGPRLVVEIEPRDAAGRATEFVGPLSLMLLAPEGEGGQQSLARWDFSPQEVKSAVNAASGDHTIRFYLELPAETPVTDSTEIWVRLLPQGGDKVLAHAAIDLQEPGRFTSLPTEPMPRERADERPQVAAIYGKTPSNTPSIPSDIDGGGWMIARPGEPAILPGDPNAADGQWRASSEPMPTAVASRAPTRAKPRVRRPASTPPAPRSKAATTAAEDVRKPGWSPDRPADEPADDPRMAATRSRPRWSATR